MSIFRSMRVSCPACDESFEMSAVESVNADRRPDLRDAILDGSFQVQQCPKCSERFRLEPMLNYLDVGHRQWISVQPLSSLPDWIENEDDAAAAFSLAYGSQAPKAAREIGEELRPRLVFGWAALREKLVVADHHLDDVALELMKLALIQGIGDLPLGDGTELRLEKIEDDELELHWINAQTEEIVERMRVPRKMYDDIVNDPDAWEALRNSIQIGTFVDMRKLYLGQGRTAVS